MRRIHAFTLIELLVVITIIVVLLALLAPALDKAIREAEMAVCAANLRSIGSASATYAMANRRMYPKRQNNYQWDALMIRNAQHPFDIRPMFQDYVGLDAFTDPLLDDQKLDDGSNSPETVIYSTYSVYTGWGVPGFQSMDRMGRHFTFQPSTSDGDLLNPTVTQGAFYRFDILAADEDYRWPGNYTTASHPDKDGLMSANSLQNEWTNPNVPATIPAVSYRATIAWYVVGGDAERGPIDTQFVHADASVDRYDDVEMFDPRMAPIVVTGMDEYNAGRQAQLPPVNRGGG